MKVLQREEINKFSMRVEDIIQQVDPVIPDMLKLCKEPIGIHRGGMAIAHCQVDAENPLTFFVMNNGDAIINPEIISEKGIIWHTEGCLSLKNTPRVSVKRSKRIKVKYLLYSNGKVSNVEKWISGIFAMIMQHEHDHFYLKYIGDKE